MYISRLEELKEEQGEFTATNAAVAYAANLRSAKTDNLIELTYAERKRVHNLKYYTWVEQQGRCVNELNDQWYDQEKAFISVQRQAAELDILIDSFNEEVGLLKSL
jgi:hypothetical protein